MAKSVYPKITVAAGHRHFTHRTPSKLAWEKGWFQQEGLSDVTIIATGKDDKTLEGLTNGTIDIGTDIRSDKVLEASDKGLKVYIIGAWRVGYPMLMFADK